MDYTTFERIKTILKGIDQEENNCVKGWWENGVGASFGAKKLKEIEDLFKPLKDVKERKKYIKDIERVTVRESVGLTSDIVEYDIEGRFKSGEKYTIATFDEDCEGICDEVVAMIKEKITDSSGSIMMSSFFYHKENEGTAKTFRNLATNRWYSEDEVHDLFGVKNTDWIKSK